MADASLRTFWGQESLDPACPTGDSVLFLCVLYLHPAMWIRPWGTPGALWTSSGRSAVPFVGILGPASPRQRRRPQHLDRQPQWGPTGWSARQGAVHGQWLHPWCGRQINFLVRS